MESNKKRRNPLTQFAPILGGVALFVLVVGITNLSTITNTLSQIHTPTTTAQPKSTTTTDVLKSLGYKEVNLKGDDPLVWYIATYVSSVRPVALSVFAACGHSVPQSECDTGYPAFATDERPVFFVVDNHVLAMLGTVRHGYDVSTQDSFSDAAVVAVPANWQNLKQLSGDQQRLLLHAMPAVEHALTLSGQAEAKVVVPPFNEKVEAARAPLNGMNLPMK